MQHSSSTRSSNISARSRSPRRQMHDTSGCTEQIQSTGDEDELAPRVLSTPVVQTEPLLTLATRIEYSAMPKDRAQDVFGLVTIQALIPSKSSEPKGPERQPMDIVCILDVSRSMRGNKLQQVKDAVKFIIEETCPSDRLGIVTFSGTAAKVLRLRRMDAEGQNDANIAAHHLLPGRGTSIAAGLDMGLSMMEGRRQRNPVSALLLLTDGRDTKPKRFQVPAFVARAKAACCSLYTFGFGSDHDASLMSDLAEQAHTPFTFVEDEGAIREAFAGAVGGLASVVGQLLHVSLRSEVPLKAVHTPFATTRLTDNDVDVRIPDIMSEERKDILVELSVPADPDAPAVNLLMKAFLQYKDLRTGTQATAPAAVLETQRCEEPLPELEPDENVRIQRERVEVTEALKQAARYGDMGQFREAQDVITRTEAKIKVKPTPNCHAMEMELQDARSRMQNRSLWDRGGRAEIRDTIATHTRQRALADDKKGKRSKQMYHNCRQKEAVAKSKRR